jgi:hypothetical protein
MVGLALALALSGAALFGALYGLDGITRLITSKPAEDALWARGTEAHVPDDYTVTTTSAKIFLEYEASFRYEDAVGVERPGHVDVWTVFWDPIHFNSPPRVRYDPARPESFVTSWQVDTGWNRAVFPSFLLVCSSFGCVLTLRELRGMAGRLSMLRRACPFGDWELVAFPVRAADGPHGRVVFWYTPSPEAPPIEFWSGGTPLFLGNGKAVMAGLRLRSEQDVIVPLANDLRPFAFSDEEARRLRDAVKALGAA